MSQYKTLPPNHTAWQPSRNAKQLEIASAPYPTCSPNGLIIKSRAVAINPVDWILQHRAQLMMTWIKWPFIVGSDVAGEVVRVGSNVTAFKPGDRVVAYCRGTDEEVNSASESAFQDYVLLHQDLCVHVPKEMSYEAASVIPLGLCTAAAGLFQKDQLDLDLPTFPFAKPNGKTLLVWGGSTSVGCNAIQLGVAAGYEVYTTCSPRNFTLMKRLGAKAAFDYNSPTVTTDLATVMKDKPTAGALSIGHGAADACFTALGQLKGRKFIAMATYPLPAEDYTGVFAMPRTVVYYLSSLVKFRVLGLMRGISYKMIFASTVCHNGVGEKVFRGFLEDALRGGGFVPAPEEEVVGRGLEAIQGAMDKQRKGVSAKKIVVSL